jgi:ribonuclease E
LHKAAEAAEAAEPEAAEAAEPVAVEAAEHVVAEAAEPVAAEAAAEPVAAEAAAGHVAAAAAEHVAAEAAEHVAAEAVACEPAQWPAHAEAAQDPAGCGLRRAGFTPANAIVREQQGVRPLLDLDSPRLGPQSANRTR